MLLVERKSMKIRGEKRFRVAGDAYVSRYVHIFVLDECKCIYQEGCSTSFRDVVRLFLLYSFRRGARRYSAANENSTKMKREKGEEIGNEEMLERVEKYLEYSRGLRNN